MKRCPACGSTYNDDTLRFCLQDGTKLVREYDPEATQVNPFPPTHAAPTVAYEAPTMPGPGPVPLPETDEPASRRKTSLVLVAIVLAVVAIALSLGVLMYQQYGSSSPVVLTSASPTPSATVAATPTPRLASATPATASPTPTPMATPSQSVVQSTPEPKPQCVLYNDTADRSGVRVRVDCDTRNCDNDSSTIADEYPDNTAVRVVKGANVRGTRFTWVKVIIIDSGATFWVASTKIKCN